MSGAHIKIDQVGRPAGVAGKSRTDGLATGAVVTLTDTSASKTTRFRLLWKPLGDTTAESSLACPDPVGAPKVWTFTPTAARYGQFVVELIKDENLPTEERQRRTFGIRTPTFGILIPAFNERASSSASLQSAGASQIDAADNNADDFPIVDLNAVRYAAWWRCWHEIVMALENGLKPEAGTGDGLVSRHVFANAASTAVGTTVLGVTVAAAPTWTTAAQIPPGNSFRVILYGPGAGGNSGKCTNAGNAFPGGGAGGSGNRRERWFSRKELIAALPITWSLALGGVGGAAVSGAGNVEGNRGTNPLAGASMGTLLTAFAGARAAVANNGVVSQGGGGGAGEESNGADGSTSNAGAGGDPFGGAGGSGGNNPSLFGGGSGGGASAKAGNSRSGGTGGGGAAINGAAPTAGGDSQEGPTGGGGGGGHNNTRTIALAGANGGGWLSPTVAGAVGGANTGLPGANGATCRVDRGGGGGAGGGGRVGTVPLTAGNGGNGGFGGGGGGGGGSAGSTDAGSNTSGKGGDGGDAAGIFEAYL